MSFDMIMQNQDMMKKQSFLYGNGHLYLFCYMDTLD